MVPVMTFLNSSTLVFIDPGIENYQSLLNGIRPGAEVFILDADRDGVKQITEVLANRSDIDSLHILSHGQAGAVQLGAAQLGGQTIRQYAKFLVQWVKAFAVEAEILLYGCEVAAGQQGKHFVEQLSQITGAAVAASTHLVGNAALGGDWMLDMQTRTIKSPLAFQSAALNAYPGVLATALSNLVYATDDLGSTTIQVLDLTTGGATSVGNIAFPTFAVSRQAVTGRVYYIETGQNGRIGYWNPADNTNVELGRTGVDVEFLKLSQAVDGTLYGLDSTTPNLYAIDPNTGAARLVGSISGGTPPFSAGSGDLAFDPNNPNRFFVNTATPDFYRIYTVDLSTLTASFVGEATGLDFTGSGSLAFGADGQLYASSTVNGTPQLYRIDQTNATPTLVGSTPVQFSDFSSLPTPTDNVDVETNVSTSAEPRPGGTITYLITVTNTSGLDLNGIRVDALIPPEVTGVSWNGEITTGSGSFPQPTDQSGTGNDFDSAVNLGGGSTVTYVVNGTISPTIPPGVTLTTTVNTNVPDGIVDPNFTNNTSTLETTVVLAGGSSIAIPPTTISPDSEVFAPTPGCRPGRQIRGTNQADQLAGGDNSDRIVGLRGNDVLRGRGCDDRVLGGQGRDRIFGNAGVDRLDGNQGRDQLDGGNGNDILNGGLGIDELQGGKGIDLLYGRRGTDRLNGNGGNDRLEAGLNDDTLRGGTNSDFLNGQQGNDRANGGRGVDTLNGGLGRDRMDGGRGRDLLVGGRANDALSGGSGGDFIRGQRNNDRLVGYSQGDILIGGGNRDTLVGGLGADTLKGGPGRDRFVYRRVREGGDTIVEFQANRDVIDLAQLFNSSQYSDSNRFEQYVRVGQSNRGTLIRVDANGDDAGGFRPLITLTDLTANTLSATNFSV